MTAAPDPAAPVPGGAACAACGTPFECGARAKAARCWCQDLPPLAPVPGRDCLCPRCLRAALESGAGAAQST